MIFDPTCKRQYFEKDGQKNVKTGTTDIVKLRKEIPDICLRTTLITGFPGETEDQHEELMQFVDEMGLIV